MSSMEKKKKEEIFLLFYPACILFLFLILFSQIGSHKMLNRSDESRWTSLSCFNIKEKAFNI